jgi:hypothetical protein
MIWNDLKKRAQEMSAFYWLILGFFPMIAATMYLFGSVETVWPQIPLHSAIEVVGSLALMALAVILAKMSQDELSFRSHWFCLGLFSMGCADLIHSLVEPGELFVWFHSMAIFSGGVFTSLVWLTQENDNLTDNTDKTTGIMAYLFGLWLVHAVVTTFSPGVVPAMLDQGQFTTAAWVLNIGGGLGFSIAAIKFGSLYLRKQEFSVLLFFMICVLNATAGLFFKYSQLWDSDWWLWHFLRLLAALYALGYMGTLLRQNLLAVGERDQLKLLLAQVRNQQEVLEKSVRQKANKEHLNQELLGVRSLAELGEVLLQNLARVCNVRVGLFYIVDRFGKIKIVGSYSHPDPDEIIEEISIGEGLVGTAVLEQRSLFLKDVPADYMPLKSGTCTIPLKQVYVYPFSHGAEVLAVVELGSLDVLTDESLAFITEIEVSVITSIMSMQKG